MVPVRRAGRVYEGLPGDSSMGGLTSLITQAQRPYVLRGEVLRKSVGRSLGSGAGGTSRWSVAGLP